jgi:UDP-N-acetylmuramate: L-alanyl-gamma-D-glutamyl-meso-diaminopimelate ligase
VSSSEGKRVHFTGICGKAMGGIAMALAREGWRVTGSDEGMYEPMRGQLSAAGIEVRSPFHQQNVPPDVDHVVIGKRISVDNAELRHVIQSGVSHGSFPQFLHRHFLQRSRNAVVAGGLGKTTTTSLLAWILEHSGRAPDYLIGGLPRNFEHPARFAGAEITVLEGDEYASCFDDRNPKFLHYLPEVAVITNIVEDHPDVYRGMEDLCEAFAALVELLPDHGRLIIPEGDGAAAKVARVARCGTVRIGFEEGGDEVIALIAADEKGTRFRFLNVVFDLPLHGRMNVMNAAMAVMAAAHLGVGAEHAAEALRGFKGIRHRQEVADAGRCALVRDKATHPRAITELARGMRQRFPGRRLVSVIQPRATGGSRWVYQRELPAALAQFDKVILTPPYEHRPEKPGAWRDHEFSPEQLRSDVKALGVAVSESEGERELLAVLSDEIADGDVLVLTLPEQAGALAAQIESVLRGDSVLAPALPPVAESLLP